MFVIFHDLCHLSFFARAHTNLRWARVMSFFILTSVRGWQGKHNFHHHVFGALDVVDTGQTVFFTKQQYASMPAWRRALLRVLREPLLFFSLVPLLKWALVYPLLRGDAFTLAGLVFHVAVGVCVTPMDPLAVYLGGLSGLVLFHLQHAVNRGAWCDAVCDASQSAYPLSLSLPPTRRLSTP
jgi:fatty acid desaturase